MNARPAVAAILLPLAASFLAACGGRDPATSTNRGDAATAPPSAQENAASSSADTSSAAAPASAPSAPAGEQARAPTPAAPPRATAAGAIAQMSGIVTRQTELKAEAAPGSRTLRTLAEKTPVTITTRQGGWLQVTSGDARGWVRLLHVSSQPAARTSGARQELEAAARVATGRAGSGNIAVTTGIRGLDEKQLREAQPDAEELKRLESLGAQPSDAQAHAKRRGLERRQVPYPSAPKAG